MVDRYRSKKALGRNGLVTECNVGKLQSKNSSSWDITGDDNFFPRHKNYDEKEEIQTEVIGNYFDAVFCFATANSSFQLPLNGALSRSLYYLIKCLETVQD